MNKYFFFGAIIAIQLIQLRLSFSNNRKLKKVMTDQEQAVADLQAVSAKLGKIGTETSTLLDKITKLEEAANNNPGTLSDELKAAIADVKEQALAVDNLVPDATDTTNSGAGAGTGEGV